MTDALLTLAQRQNIHLCSTYWWRCNHLYGMVWCPFIYIYIYSWKCPSWSTYRDVKISVCIAVICFASCLFQGSGSSLVVMFFALPCNEKAERCHAVVKWPHSVLNMWRLMKCDQDFTYIWWTLASCNYPWHVGSRLRAWVQISVCGRLSRFLALTSFPLMTLFLHRWICLLNVCCSTCSCCPTEHTSAGEEGGPQHLRSASI